MFSPNVLDGFLSTHKWIQTMNIFGKQLLHGCATKTRCKKLYCDSNKNKLVQHVTKTSKLQDGQGKPNLKPTLNCMFHLHKNICQHFQISCNFQKSISLSFDFGMPSKKEFKTSLMKTSLEKHKFWKVDLYFAKICNFQTKNLSHKKRW